MASGSDSGFVLINERVGPDLPTSASVCAWNNEFDCLDELNNTMAQHVFPLEIRSFSNANSHTFIQYLVLHA